MDLIPEQNHLNILNKVCAFYQNTLEQEQKIKALLFEQFKLTPADIANSKLGFSDGSLLKTIPQNGPVVEALKQLGILDEKAKEIFLGCIIIPELDQQGNCLKLMGKQLSELKESDFSHLAKEEPKPITIPLPCQESIQFLSDGLSASFGLRKYLLRGIDNSNPKTLRLNIKAIGERRFHIDTVDLYLAKQRKAFAKEGALLFACDSETIESDLNKIILHLENYIIHKKDTPTQVAVLNDKDRDEALKFLRAPDLIEQILADFEVIGCCGEKTNKLIGYLAAISRKLDDPLSLLILSRSAAGKSTLQDAILEFVPEEDKAKYTRITGQALFYKAKDSLQHKLIAIEEEEGANEASYSIRAMQSSKFLTIATTIKDPLTGSMKTQEYQVKGPLSIILTTTRTDIDYETASRFIVLTIDESRLQTQAIHKLQREADTLTGLLREAKKEAVVRRHHNAQRLLRPVKVVNPYAHLLTFADDRLRLRRDHKKYLNLIKTITFLYQYQRPIKQVIQLDKTIDYIEVSLEDIILANAIADEVFGRSLEELAPPSKELLFLIREMVKQMAKAQGISETKVRFSRRDIREYTGWSDNQTRDHLRQLVDLEYVIITSGSNGSRYFYELAYDGRGENGQRFFMGLIDIKTLRNRLNPVPKKEHLVPSLSGACGHLVQR